MIGLSALNVRMTTQPDPTPPPSKPPIQDGPGTKGSGTQQ